MSLEKNEHQIIHDLMQDNKQLLIQNNDLLKKLNRRSIWTFWLKIVWFMFLIGLPFVFYYYVVEPYFDTLGSSFEVFRSGLQEIPGWKQFYEAAKGGGIGGQ